MQNPDVQGQSGGWLLPPRLRAQMEALFDAQLSDVRIYMSLQPLALGALAYAQGNSIFFAPGCYDPVSRPGRALLAHELTHVLQQRAGRVAPPLQGLVVEDARLEREADAMAARTVGLPVLAREGPALGIGGRLSRSAPIQRQVIWVAFKKSEYGFEPEVDQLEVDETADTLVSRGHGPKFGLNDNYQLQMGSSKYIYLVGHSTGKNVSGYSADEVFGIFAGKGLVDHMKLKIMACNAGMIGGFVVNFQKKLVGQYEHVEVKGVDRIICYTNETKFLFTDYPPVNKAEYDVDTLKKQANDELVENTWQALKKAFVADPNFLPSLSAFYQRWGTRANEVAQSIQKIDKDSGVAWKALLDKIAKYIKDNASPKLAYELRNASAVSSNQNCKHDIDLAFQVFNGRVSEGWLKKKAWLRKHHHLDPQDMSGPQRLKKAIDKGDPTVRPLRPYLPAH